MESNSLASAVAELSVDQKPDEQAKENNGGVSISDTQTAQSPQTKREDYISWDEFFMGMAVLASHRSKDPCTQVGAVIVDNKTKIIQGVGYNGFARGCPDDALPWGKGAENKLNTKYYYVCHAEMNAVLNRNTASSNDCTIYVSLFPCNECSKLIIQSGIRKVVYMDEKDEKPEMQASRKMFEMVGIELVKFSTEREEIRLKLQKTDE